MELIFHPEAAEELRRGFGLLREAPLKWPADSDGIRRMRLRKFPYALMYALGVDQVRLLAVAHLHRRPGYWRQRVRN